MKVSVHTPELLIVDSRPWFIPMVLIGCLLGLSAWGLAAIAAGSWIEVCVAGALGAVVAYFFWVALQRHQLILNRRTNEAIWRERRLFRFVEETRALTDLARVSVDTIPGTKGPLFCVILQFDGGMDAGPRALTSYYSNDPRHRELAQILNDWLDSPVAEI